MAEKDEYVRAHMLEHFNLRLEEFDLKVIVDDLEKLNVDMTTNNNAFAAFCKMLSSTENVNKIDSFQSFMTFFNFLQYFAPIYEGIVSQARVNLEGLETRAVKSVGSQTEMTGFEGGSNDNRGTYHSGRTSEVEYESGERDSVVSDYHERYPGPSKPQLRRVTLGSTSEHIEYVVITNTDLEKILEVSERRDRMELRREIVRNSSSKVMGQDLNANEDEEEYAEVDN